MAFIVEDGTVVADANSYAAVAYADAYFADRLITDWTGTDPEKQAALIKGTDYIETMFGARFKGEPIEENQSLYLPTDYWGEVVPNDAQKATCEYALRALVAELAPDPVVSDSGIAVKRTKSVVGPISDETEYMETGPGATPTLLKPYPAADMLLAPLLRSISKVIRG